MRFLAFAVLAAVIVAGCAAPEPTPTTDGPLSMTGKLGLLAVDLTEGRVTVLSERPGPAWLSSTGTFVTWIEGEYAVLLETATNSRQVVKPTAWTRIYDNGTGMALRPEGASWRELTTGNTTSNVTLPPAPIPGAAWTTASDDLQVLGGEYATPESDSCSHDLYIRAASSQRTNGCHLRVAADGRVAWTELTGVRVRAKDGTLTNLTGTGGGDIASQQFVSNENPVFTADGVIHLRMTGGQQIRLSEIVTEDGTVLANMDGNTRLALHDVSADGKFILVGAFTR